MEGLTNILTKLIRDRIEELYVNGTVKIHVTYTFSLEPEITEIEKINFKSRKEVINWMLKNYNLNSKLFEDFINKTILKDIIKIIVHVSNYINEGVIFEIYNKFHQILKGMKCE